MNVGWQEQNLLSVLGLSQYETLTGDDTRKSGDIYHPNVVKRTGVFRPALPVWPGNS